MNFTLPQLPDIPLLLPDIPDYGELGPWLRRIDNSRHYTNFGPLNAELCRALASYCSEHAAFETPCHAQTFCNATAALTAWLLHVLGPANAPVLLPGITFVATAQAILASGNVPLIADVDAESWLLTPQHAHHAASRQTVAAVMPVAAFGTACDASGWDRFTRSTGIPVLIDAAGAFGNQAPGQSTDVVFSLHATKALAAGEGGAIVSTDKARIQALTRISNFGIDLESGLATGPGFNAKFSEYHAAVALAGLARWPENVRRRRAVMALYQTLLATHCPSVRLPRREDGGVYTLLPILLPPPHDAGAVGLKLARDGIQTRRWYCPPLPGHAAFAHLPRATELPVCEQLGQRLLGLPFHPWLSENDVQRVAASLAACLNGTSPA